MTDISGVQFLRQWPTVLRAVRCEVYRVDGKYVGSRIMWGFLAFHPPLYRLTFTSAHLGLKLKIVTMKRRENLLSSFGMLLDEQLSSNVPELSTKGHRSTLSRLIVFPFVLCTCRDPPRTHSLLEFVGCRAENGKHVLLPIFETVKMDLTELENKGTGFCFFSPDICMFDLQSMHLPSNNWEVI